MNKAIRYLFVLPVAMILLSGCNETNTTVNPEIEEMAHPVLSEDGHQVKYGLYPQTNVNDADLISKLNKIKKSGMNGWYLYNGNYYAKTLATPCEYNYSTDNIFDNGVNYTSGTTYWFKCEPIIWNVLDSEDGCFLLSNMILDTHVYYETAETRTIDNEKIYPNNYKYSSIRSWLNDQFYQTAFASGDASILVTTVDNSRSTFRYPDIDYRYECENTLDKVFLPSYHDYTSKKYGFSESEEESETRCCKTTDWARAKGAFLDSQSATLPFGGVYSSRSPHSLNHMISGVQLDGNIQSTYGVLADGSGVRPAIRVSIETTI